MKTHRDMDTNTLQPLTAADLEYIRSLAAEHSIGLEHRCARYRRCASFRNVSAAACLFALVALGADTAYTQPPRYSWTTLVGDTTAIQASDAINGMLDKI